MSVNDQDYKEGYAACKAQAIAHVTEIMRVISSDVGVEEYKARMETLQHVRAGLRAMSNRRTR